MFLLRLQEIITQFMWMLNLRQQPNSDRRIAHGALSASFISAVLGNELPGPGAVFVELNLRFRKPAFIGDLVTAVAEVSEINLRTGRVKMKCYCEVNGNKICRGDAGVFVSKRPII